MATSEKEEPDRSPTTPSYTDEPPFDSDKDVENDVERGSTVNGAVETTEAPADPNIVSWDGPDDPENPQNWPFKRKFAAVAIVSAITFISPLASSVFAPGIGDVMKEFHSTSEELSSFVVSVFVIGFCFGPLVIAPLSEMYGRMPVYHCCNVIFFAFSIACAVAPNLGSLIAFRFLAGLGGSCPLAIGAGTIADVTPPERRGQVMAAWVFGPILGPIIGPIAGGYLTQGAGWRWCLWLVAIAEGIVTVAAFIFMQETYAVAILNKKAKKLRASTGNTKLRSALDSGLDAKAVFSLAIVRPSKMLVCSPIVLLLSLQMFLVYGYLYLIFTAIPVLFLEKYNFNTGNIGLTYIGLGLGSLVGLIVTGATTDRIVTRLAAKNGGERKPEYRIPLVIVASFFIPAGLFWFGWTGETNQHWILPILGIFIMGLGMTPIFMSVTTYLVDSFDMYAASAVAASTVLRSLGGALLPLAGRPMFAKLGLGWGASLLAFIALAMAPVPIAFYIFGERIRQKTFFGVKF